MVQAAAAANGEVAPLQKPKPAAKARAVPESKPLQLGEDDRPQAPPPSQHMIVDKWFDKVGVPKIGSGADEDELGAAPAAWHAEAVPHLSEGQLESFYGFMRQGLRDALRDIKPLLQFHERSVMVLTSEEVESRAIDMVVPTMPRRKLAETETARRTEHATVGPLASAGSRDAPRFTMELKPELLYFRAPPMNAQQAVAQATSYFVTAVVPMVVTDVGSNFSFETQLELDQIPMMTEGGTFVVVGNPWALVHGVRRHNAVYFATEDMKSVQRWTLSMLSTNYGRIDVQAVEKKSRKSSETEVFLSSHGPLKKVLFPALDLLVGLGASEMELRQMRNFHALAPIGTEIPSRQKACENLCELAGFRTEGYGNDAVKTLNMRLKPYFTRSIGRAGRQRYNERLGLNLDQDNLTLLDVIACVDLVWDAALGKRTLQVDDVDSLENKRIISCGEVFADWCREWCRYLVLYHGGLPIRVDSRTMETSLVSVKKSLGEFIYMQMWGDNSWQMVDDCNALSELVMTRKVSQVGNLGLDTVMRIQGLRIIHATQYGRVCPVETGDGKAAGISQVLAALARIDEDGNIVVPHQRVKGGKRMLSSPWEYLKASEQSQFRVAQFDSAHLEDGTLVPPKSAHGGGDNGDSGESAAPADLGDLKQRLVTAVHLSDFKSVAQSQVDYITCGPPMSVAVSTIPFLEHDDANRLLMGAKMSCQGVPTLYPERPIAGTGLEAHVGSCSGWNAFASMDSQVLAADSTVVHSVASAVTSMEEVDMSGVESPPLPEGWTEEWFRVCSEIESQPLVDSVASKKHTSKHQSCLVSPGDQLARGEIIGEGSSFSGGELAVGRNIMVAYVSWNGYNYEDAMVISKRMVREDVLTSVHIDEVSKMLREDETLMTEDVFGDLEDDPSYERLVGGTVPTGAYVTEGDLLFAVDVLSATQPEMGREWLEGDDPKQHMKAKRKRMRRHVRVPDGVEGRVIGTRMDRKKRGRRVEISLVAIIAKRSPIVVGDKLSGRHGNKGIVANIVEDRDMPYLPDGTPIDICLNPLGVPSRMNVGQIFEVLLSTAGRWNGEEYRLGQFDEMYAEEASRGVVFEMLRKAVGSTGYKWLLDPESPGKTRLFDGKTGRPFDQPMTAGVSYILKLNHMVSSKVIARGNSMNVDQATGQPVRGRKRGGGQRVGEMEVSALVGHGASAALQEMMTIKSDDVFGRLKLNKILPKGEKVTLPPGATSEGYRTFRSELAAAGFQIVEGRAGQRPGRR